ncbi:MAG TPA: hypothetical protein PKD72_12765 [Gemmatales bacterium]|nr:hypothetical protein [Gemmatales bacterium]
MTNYPVRCYGEGCEELASYKVAAQWSHGHSSELKTYGLACRQCLPKIFLQSLERQKKVKTLPGELGEAPGIYCMLGAWRDRELVRDMELEKAILARHESKTR